VNGMNQELLSRPSSRDLTWRCRPAGSVPTRRSQVFIDTSALNEVSIDTAARIAHAGAETTWSALNSHLPQHRSRKRALAADNSAICARIQ